MTGLLAVSGLLLALAVPGLAVAQPMDFDVPAQPAVTAIPEFARQAGVQIVAPADELKHIRTPALRGRMEVRAALERLITGAGLEIAAVRDGVIILRVAPRLSPIAPRPAAPRPATQASEVAAEVQPVLATEVEALVVMGGGQARQARAPCG